MPGALVVVPGVVVVVPGVAVVPGVVVLGVVWVPVVPGDVALVPVCAPVVPPDGLPAGALLVWAAATPIAIHKADAARKFFGMGLLFVPEISTLIDGMRRQRQEMGENQSS